SATDSVIPGNIGGIALGLSAAAQGTNDALKRGMSDDQAFWNGFFSGVFEGVFETLSIGQLKALKASVASVPKDIAKNIAKSMLVNPTEEVLTELANIAYDVVVNGDFSDYETSIRIKTTFEGMSEAEAKRVTALELGGRVAEAAGSGTLMGFGFGFAGSVISIKNTSAIGKKLNAEGMGEPLIALGQTMENGSDAQKFAAELASKNKVTNADIGKLYFLISEQAQDMTPQQIYDKAKKARNIYRVIRQEDASNVTEADVEEFCKATGMDVTAKDLIDADVAVDEDSVLVQAAHTERETNAEPYIPPTSKDIKAYDTEETRAYSRALSREVRFYDGASHARAEAGFVENGVVYINKNAPVNRNSVAVVLAHEYTHTIEGTDAYTKLADTVFGSAAYSRMLATAGRDGGGLLQEEYLQQIIDDYAANHVTIDKEGAKKEALARFLSEYVLQDVNRLIDLARTDRNCFQQMYAQIRRFIARLCGQLPNNRELIKIERMFAKAAKAANSGAVVQKSPAATSGVQYSLDPYSDQQIENWRLSKKIIVYENEAQLFQFVYHARRDGSFVKKMYFGKVSAELARRIKQDTKIEALGRNVTLRADNVRKIFRDHGTINTEEPRGQRPITEFDFTKIPDIIGDPDVIESGSYIGKPAIQFKKTINGSRITVFAVDSGTSSLDLYVQTMFAGQKKEGDIAYTADANSPTHTSETPVGTIPTISIPTSSEKSNTPYSISDDTAYMDAAKRGNRDTARRVIDEAADAANIGNAAAQTSPADKSGAQRSMPSGTQYSLNIFHSNGTVEQLADARNITEEQVAVYLRQAKEGELYDSTYIPVRSNTPEVIINSLAGINKIITDRSMVMQVRKVRQAMRNDSSKRISKKHGRNTRGHGLSVDQILEILRSLDEPTTIVYQTNRVDKDGNPSPDNVAVFVEYKNNSAEGVAVVEFDAKVDAPNTKDDFGDEIFHTVVTLLEPDTFRDGLP
ncbi:MAG: hypothetical protein ACI4WZ_04180, partial [Eubacteriales bacterium]